jgi:hypothetical protein
VAGAPGGDAGAGGDGARRGHREEPAPEPAAQPEQAARAAGYILGLEEPEVAGVAVAGAGAQDVLGGERAVAAVAQGGEGGHGTGSFGLFSVVDAGAPAREPAAVHVWAV